MECIHESHFRSCGKIIVDDTPETDCILLRICKGNDKASAVKVQFYMAIIDELTQNYDWEAASKVVMEAFAKRAHEISEASLAMADCSNEQTRQECT